MSIKKGFFSVPIFLPIAVGILLLGAVLLLSERDDVEVDAARFYEVKDISAQKTSGLYLGPVTNDTSVTINDIINITAVNESIPTLSEDKLIIDLNLTDSNGHIAFNTTIELSYSGSNSDFYGNITFKKNLGQNFKVVSGGIELDVADGSTVYIKNHLTGMTYLRLNVDNMAPLIETIEDPSMIYVADGKAYATNSSSIELDFSDNDTLSTRAWAIANQKVNYTWDSGAEQNWGGSAIPIPSDIKKHDLKVDATDRFNQKKTYIFSYFVTETLSGSLNESMTYENQTVLSGPLRIVAGGSLDLINSTFILMDSGDDVIVEEGGYLNITGPKDASSGNQSVFKCSSDGMSIVTLPGSHLLIEDTLILDSDTSSKKATIQLFEGTMERCHIEGPNVGIWIRSHDITIKDSVINGLDASNGIFVDADHTWSVDPIEISNVTFEGTFDVPLRIANNSIWKPIDVPRAYYLENQNISFSFTMVDSSYVDPYLYFPHFFDSRSPEATLTAWYNNSGSWELLPPFPLADEIRDNWTNGEDAKIDLSSVPNGADVKFIFNATDGNNAVIYVGDPYLGSSSRPNVPLGTLSLEFNNFWKNNEVTDNSLLLEEIMISSADENFIEVFSSGMTEISHLNISSPTINNTSTAEWAIVIEKGSLDLIDSNILGYQNLSGFIYFDFEGNNDWPMSKVDNITIEADTPEAGYGIMARSVELNIGNTTIRNVTTGIGSINAIIDLYEIDLTAGEYGIEMKLPSVYPKDIDISLEGIIVRGELEYSGLSIDGTLTSITDIKVTDLDIQSTYNGTYARDDGFGAIILDVTSTMEANILFDDVIASTGPGHGVAILNWPDNGGITLEDATLTDQGLDGVWMDDKVDLLLKRCDISLNDGWGIYGFEGSLITIQSEPDGNKCNIISNELGGLKIMDDTTITISHAVINKNKGVAVEMGEDVTASFDNSEIKENEMGVKGQSGCDISFFKVNVEGTSNGPGVEVTSCDLTIEASTPKSMFNSNAMEGLKMWEGNLSIQSGQFKSNNGNGIYLEDVQILNFQNVNSSLNKGSGIYIMIDDNDLLDSQGKYCIIKESWFSENTVMGLTIETGDSIPGIVEVELNGFISYGNEEGDLIAGDDIHFTWNCTSGKDKLGNSDFTGITIANLDITVENNGLQIFNEEIRFLNDGAAISLGPSHTLEMVNAYIRPDDSDDRWYMITTGSSKVNIQGCYFGYMGSFEVESVVAFQMDETLIVHGERGIQLIDTKLTIDSCRFLNIEESALRIEDSHGVVTDSIFKGDGKGIIIDGLSSDLTIIGCEFTNNDWGIYVFKGGDQTDIKVEDSSFEGNVVAPIWLSRNNMTLEDTDIDPNRIIVKEITQKISIFYTLEVIVKDEGDHDQVFNADLKFGDSASAIKVTEKVGKWQDMYKIYEVTPNGYSKDREHLRLTISYLESTGSKRVWAYINDDFTLTTRTTKVYTSYKAPFTEEYPTIIQGMEDIGLNDGSIDISKWFSDIGTDEGNLSFKVESLSPYLNPKLIGSMMSVDLEKDWNGEGRILVTATDPHGKSLTLNITIFIVGSNDVPIITEPRIISITGTDTIPRTGSTITALWNWHDIDNGDTEPSTKYVRWFLNGTAIRRYGTNTVDNVTTINGVKEGQIWSFKVWPMDVESIYSNQFGEPVMSPVIQVLGQAPRFKSDLTYNTNKPKTDQDIIITPGTYEDADSNVVTFNYQWEVLNRNDKWVPIGAPNSPILDSRFTEKGMDIRVLAWISDGTSQSGIKTAYFEVVNSAPIIISGKLTPEILIETDDLVTIKDLNSFDADGDQVTYFFNWSVGGTSIGVNYEVPQLPWSFGGWSYPGRATITVNITPIDSDNRQGESISLSAILIPTDTDGDSYFDDINGDGENDSGDDTDDDNDGYLDHWEIELRTDPKNRLSFPMDLDHDGAPDGTPGNPFNWMDTDDDDDGILDSEDSYPNNGALPGDLDGDGIGDDVDSDIDGDGRENLKDYDPYNDQVQSAPKIAGQSLIEVFIFILVLIIVAVIAAVAYAIYTDKIHLPNSAPPTIMGEGGAEAIFEEDLDGRSKADEMEEMEELENMSVCSVCGELVSMDLETCPNCGAEFEEPEEEEFMEED